MTPEIINGIFALTGALIGVIGSYIVVRTTRKVSRLSIHKSPLAKLLDVGDLVQSDVEIRYKGSPVIGLFGGEISIHNNGNQSVESITLTITTQDDSPLIDFEVGSSSFSIDRKVIPSAVSDNSLTVSIPFLNPKDRISYVYKVTGNGRRPEVHARLRDVDIAIRDEMTNWIPDIYAEAMFERMAKDPLNRLVFSAFFKPFRLYLESKRKSN